MKSLFGMPATEKKRKNGWSETNGISADSFKRPKVSSLFGLSNQTSKAEKQNVLQQKQELPIYSAKQRCVVFFLSFFYSKICLRPFLIAKRFLEEVVKSETVILVGETGSGKTTQIPQFIFEAK